MATKIKDSATAERAAMNLQQGLEVVQKSGEPTAPAEKTTSEKLFPEFTTDDGGITNRPVKPYSDTSKVLPATETPVVTTPPGQMPTAPTPTAPVYLTADELTGKMVRLKVDGIEQDVPAETLIKTNQLERHLNAQLMNLAQERKQFEDERRRLTATPPAQTPSEPAKPAAKKNPEMDATEVRFAQMQAEMAALQQAMLPAIQESGIKRVEQLVKNQLGANDFRTYFEKIRDSAVEQMAKPENANDPNARRYFDSDGYYFEKYKELKIKELMAPKASTPAVNPSAPVLQGPEGAPVVISNSGKPVSIPSFEASGGVPSRQSPDASWQSTYNALFARAQESGRQEDWAALYRHKIRSPE